MSGSQKYVAHNVDCAMGCGRAVSKGIWRNGTLVGVCWICHVHSAMNESAEELIVCETQGVARVDGGRWGGGVECEECGRVLYAHPADPDHPFLTIHCDGRLVKL